MYCIYRLHTCLQHILKLDFGKKKIHFLHEHWTGLHGPSPPAWTRPSQVLQGSICTSHHLIVIWNFISFCIQYLSNSLISTKPETVVQALPDSALEGCEAPAGEVSPPAPAAQVQAVVRFLPAAALVGYPTVLTGHNGHHHGHHHGLQNGPDRRSPLLATYATTTNPDLKDSPVDSISNSAGGQNKTVDSSKNSL